MKVILHSIFIFLFSISSAQAVQDTTELKKYAQELIDEGYRDFNDVKLSKFKKKNNARHFIQSHLDLNWMADHALGRNRRALSKSKINEFSQVYTKFVIKSYADLSTSYNGEKPVLKKIRQIDDEMFIVNMEIINPNGQPPIRVDYLVLKNTDNNKSKFLVGDIITEGISILNSQQAEFNSVIANHGVDTLINDLRNRTNVKH